MASSNLAIEVKDLHKNYGELEVLKGVNLKVEKGKVFALLGPNGAGKTTTVRILATLLLPGKGTVKVNGYDVVEEAEQVRTQIGLTGQFAAVDQYLTGEENLRLIARLNRMSVEDSKRRAEQLLIQFDLVKAGKRPVKNYSGGMRRKLDLAMSLISKPPIIFLDEPTTGLDPRSRMAMWDMIKQLTSEGITILLTTQYMDEADSLADDIVVIDNGKVIAEGTASQLKAKIGSDRLEVIVSKPEDFTKAETIMGRASRQSDPQKHSISVATKRGVADVKQTLQKLEDAGIAVESVSLHSPTLDDVFLTLTGHAAKSDKPAKKKGKK